MERKRPDPEIPITTSEIRRIRRVFFKSRVGAEDRPEELQRYTLRPASIMFHYGIAEVQYLLRLIQICSAN